jgi:hypothetical protein
LTGRRLRFDSKLRIVKGFSGKFFMNHKGVEYTVVKSYNPKVWKWQFRIGDMVKNGKTETNLELLAMRRAQLKINRALNMIAHGETP